MSGSGSGVRCASPQRDSCWFPSSGVVRWIVTTLAATIQASTNRNAMAPSAPSSPRMDSFSTISKPVSIRTTPIAPPQVDPEAPEPPKEGNRSQSSTQEHGPQHAVAVLGVIGGDSNSRIRELGWGGHDEAGSEQEDYEDDARCRGNLLPARRIHR